MKGHSTVACRKSRRRVALPEAEGEKGNMSILRTTWLFPVFLTKPFSLKTLFIFALEAILQHGWYVPSSKGNPASEAIFRLVGRSHILDNKNNILTFIKMLYLTYKTSLSACLCSILGILASRLDNDKQKREGAKYDIKKMMQKGRKSLTYQGRKVKTHTKFIGRGGIDMKLLKASEVCRLCSISRKSLYRWMKSGTIKGIRTPGGHLRFDMDEVERLFLKPEKNQRVAG